MPARVHAISDVDFRKQVLQSGEPVLVAFRAAWCRPSQELASVVDGVAKKYEGRVRVVSVEMNGKTEKLRRAYKVDRVPLLMVFKEGLPRDFIGGATDEANVSEMLEAQLKPVVDLSEINFRLEVLRSRVPVLVHFWAAWCKQSLEMEQVIQEVANRFRGRAKVARLEQRPDTARLFGLYGVKRVPTTAVIHNGRMQDEIFGGMKAGSKEGAGAVDRLSEMLERYVL